MEKLTTFESETKVNFHNSSEARYVYSKSETIGIR